MYRKTQTVRADSNTPWYASYLPDGTDRMVWYSTGTSPNTFKNCLLVQGKLHAIATTQFYLTAGGHVKTSGTVITMNHATDAHCWSSGDSPHASFSV